MNGRLISVSITCESSILAFSAASFSRCRAMRSLPRSMPWSFLNSLDDPLHDAMVDVVAAQVRVAGRGLYFHHAFAHFQDGNIKRSAAQVVDRDGFVLLLVQAVGQSRGRRLVDDAQHFQAGDFSRLLGGLPLAVVEIGGNGDDRLGDLLAEKIFRGASSASAESSRKFRAGCTSCRKSPRAHHRADREQPCKACAWSLRRLHRTGGP